MPRYKAMDLRIMSSECDPVILMGLGGLSDKPMEGGGTFRARHFH